MKTLNALLATFLLVLQMGALQAATLPKNLQLTYEVTKNGQPFAKVKEQFEIVDNHYKLESITKGIGVYALFGERVLTSAGDVTVDGLKPQHFELHQGDNEKKALYTDFEWENNNLHMRVKSRDVNLPLESGTQDLASFAYQFMWLPKPLKSPIEITLTTGKKLNQYRYAVTETSTLNIMQKSIAVLHLTPVEAADKNVRESKHLWLAPDYYHLPVKILMVDDQGQTLEQTLIDINAH